MLWTIIVLISKGNSGDFRGIVSLKVVWKVITHVLAGQLFKKLNDALHGFRAKKGCGTRITKAKLSQQLAFLESVLQCGFFIDLHKAHDAMDREQCL